MYLALYGRLYTAVTHVTTGTAFTHQKLYLVYISFSTLITTRPSPGPVRPGAGADMLAV